MSLCSYLNVKQFFPARRNEVENTPYGARQRHTPYQHGYDDNVREQGGEVSRLTRAPYAIRLHQEDKRPRHQQAQGEAQVRQSDAVSKPLKVDFQYFVSV